ncbi:hypothetical protein VOLCADRAFT_93608 [Volvox carteri f. nagariensis]|uniref:RAP domain-containing protein n=1 Tax=Volvox carteri f. nagariensis TaxID=3068 RepID=D8U2K1_VOLCA|nr:uncharacterized protein VOLCADRAFT_93608 [Volvox carteri f. nagariensis]EFJ46072.1 hypothetical protein VOLCADRAFT_93608 [Volvox carteri f. nagariensis]|eukprot:XP_002952822.1 hypothetical protein VOLCADRAFT_93608 [Volvox carteri f. nagariensis]
MSDAASHWHPLVISAAFNHVAKTGYWGAPGSAFVPELLKRLRRDRYGLLYKFNGQDHANLWWALSQRELCHHQPQHQQLHQHQHQHQQLQQQQSPPSPAAPLEAVGDILHTSAALLKESCPYVNTGRGLQQPPQQPEKKEGERNWNPHTHQLVAGSLRPQVFSNIILAASRLNYRHDVELIDGLLSCMVQHVGPLQAQQQQPPQPPPPRIRGDPGTALDPDSDSITWFAVKLACHVRERIQGGSWPGCAPQSLSNITWALAVLGYDEQSCYTAVVQAALRCDCMAHARPQEWSALLWSLASVRHRPFQELVQLLLPPPPPAVNPSLRLLHQDEREDQDQDQGRAEKGYRRGGGSRMYGVPGRADGPYPLDRDRMYGTYVRSKGRHPGEDGWGREHWRELSMVFWALAALDLYDDRVMTWISKSLLDLVLLDDRRTVTKYGVETISGMDPQALSSCLWALAVMPEGTIVRHVELVSALVATVNRLDEIDFTELELTQLWQAQHVKPCCLPPPPPLPAAPRPPLAPPHNRGVAACSSTGSSTITSALQRSVCETLCAIMRRSTAKAVEAKEMQSLPQQHRQPSQRGRQRQRQQPPSTAASDVEDGGPAVRAVAADDDVVVRILRVEPEWLVEELALRVDLCVWLSDGRQVVVEVDGPSHYFANQPRTRRPKTALRDRQLGRVFGPDNVKCVPYWEWDELRYADVDVAARREELLGRLLELWGNGSQ